MEKEKQIQEDSYRIPYHWFMRSNDFYGRVYFGYLSLCLGFLGDVSGKNILDAGCGDGRFLDKLREYGVKNLYGIDYSERAVSFAKILVPEANIKTGDIFSLPYEDGFFDVIFLIEVLEHIQIHEVKKYFKRIKESFEKRCRINYYCSFKIYTFR